MTRLIVDRILLAQPGRAEEFARGFHRHGQLTNRQLLLALLLVGGLVVAAVVISRLLARWQQRRSHDSPWRLFLALAKAHRLSWRQQWLLWRVARAQGLRDPARLFVEPRRVSAAEAGWPGEKGRASLKQLRQRLFDGLENEPGLKRPPPDETLGAPGPQPAEPTGLVPLER